MSTMMLGSTSRSMRSFSLSWCAATCIPTAHMKQFPTYWSKKLRGNKTQPHEAQHPSEACGSSPNGLGPQEGPNYVDAWPGLVDRLVEHFEAPLRPDPEAAREPQSLKRI